MQTKPCLVLAVAVCFVLFVTNYRYCRSDSPVRGAGRESSLQQRNELSRMLDRSMMKLNQQACEKGAGTSDSGGWCNKALTSQHMFDRTFVRALATLFSKVTVAGFGDGPGAYKNALANVTMEYSAFDGSPFVENMTNHQVSHMDLSIPQYGLKGWDWVMSLEVAEHIPAVHEEVFLSNVVRHAKLGVVLSWAKPGQGGFAHVNGRTDEWVRKKMLQLCFVYNSKLTAMLRSAASFSWLKDNTNVFERRGCPFDEEET